MRRATISAKREARESIDFYPRSPCGERHDATLHCLRVMRISIHALLAESDLLNRRFRAVHNAFLSTLSLRRATNMPNFAGEVKTDFYPRSPCGERLPYQSQVDQKSNFYPRSPCGERRQIKQTYQAKISISIHALLAESDFCKINTGGCKKTFLSTLSLRRATVLALCFCGGA